MADFFKYLWHCISGAISCVSGYVPDDFTWKDLGVAVLIFVLTIVIVIAILLKLKIIRWNISPKVNSKEDSRIDESLGAVNQSPQDNSNENMQSDETDVLTEILPQGNSTDVEKREIIAPKNKIRMLKNSVYMLVLGGIMICLLIAILLMSLLFDKPFVAGDLAMLILFWVLFIMLTIVMIMMLVQYIIIDSNGIKVTCFNKILTSIRWNEIANIEVEYHFKIPMYKIILVNGKSISFIQRKKFKLATITYGTEKIQQMINNLN